MQEEIRCPRMFHTHPRAAAVPAGLFSSGGTTTLLERWGGGKSSQPSWAGSPSRSVRRRVEGHQREHVVLVATLAPQHGGPEAFRVAREDVVGAGGLHDPGLLLHLLLQLARAPTGVAGEDPGPEDPTQDVGLQVRGSESDGAEDGRAVAGLAGELR